MSHPTDLESGTIPDLATLEDRLSAPPPALVKMFRRTPGDLMILGVGGKMGPTLAWMARRAADAAGTPRRILGVARFSAPALPGWLKHREIEPVRADLLEPGALEGLPDAPLVVLMTGMKFGTSEAACWTWATNALLPGLVARRYPRSRIAAFSTGNVYGLTRPASGGSREDDPLEPIGEYAMSAVGRERILESQSLALGAPLAILRLNYATELRYGVLVDLARKVWEGHTIDLSMGYLNAIWQADASALALQSLEHAASPPLVLNIAGPEVLRVRDLAESFGRLLGRQPVLRGVEADDALLSNATRAFDLLGRPVVRVEQQLAWVADWVRQGGPTLGRPTHFEVRDGRF